jgi:sulfatase modifying factor 1
MGTPVRSTTTMAPALDRRIRGGMPVGRRARHPKALACLTSVWLLGCDTTGTVLDAVDSATLSEPGEAAVTSSESGTSDANDSATGVSDAGDSNTGTGTSPPPSCISSIAGTTNCGASVESCCASLEVAGGTFDRVYTNTGNGATGLANPATVSGFRLDKYDVTVGRFRQFAGAWSVGYRPAPGSGKHTHLNDGHGLANSSGQGGYEPGWAATDDSNVAPTTANLQCDAANATWTASAGTNETLPITCGNWYEAYAFCIWDGGFLPSEAEWEYAWAGGAGQREFPWGTTEPGTNNRYAIYGCYYPPSGSATCMGVPNIAPVGTATLGAGLWGQLDLAGEVYQWDLDSYADYVNPCNDCAFLTALLPFRVRRGGAFGYDETVLRPPARYHDTPSLRDGNFGFRCARAP